ncbi:hypothetical protein BT96DRAFT_951741 [Gymnopus androsaceus JB14]|uniref:Uncharacterized protein n=1 Tax=Gymnopus androsaceus JB14 TaxID=1447944 RepID=A0A6A4GBW0_9AGAR|nr:hypothetical protein BT96DRAFT_951741 [Gymnopus androsaceus JB14]
MFVHRGSKGVHNYQVNEETWARESLEFGKDLTRDVLLLSFARFRLTEFPLLACNVLLQITGTGGAASDQETHPDEDDGRWADVPLQPKTPASESVKSASKFEQPIEEVLMRVDSIPIEGNVEINENDAVDEEVDSVSDYASEGEDDGDAHDAAGAASLRDDLFKKYNWVLVKFKALPISILPATLSFSNGSLNECRTATSLLFEQFVP